MCVRARVRVYFYLFILFIVVRCKVFTLVYTLQAIFVCYSTIGMAGHSITGSESSLRLIVSRKDVVPTKIVTDSFHKKCKEIRLNKTKREKSRDIIHLCVYTKQPIRRDIPCLPRRRLKSKNPRLFTASHLLAENFERHPPQQSDVADPKRFLCATTTAPKLAI